MKKNTQQPSNKHWYKLGIITYTFTISKSSTLYIHLGMNVDLGKCGTKLFLWPSRIECAKDFAKKYNLSTYDDLTQYNNNLVNCKTKTLCLSQFAVELTLP